MTSGQESTVMKSNEGSFLSSEMVILDEANEDSFCEPQNSNDESNDDSGMEYAWEISPELPEVTENENDEKEKKPEESDDNAAPAEIQTTKLPFSVPCYDEEFTGYLTEKEFCIDTGKHIKNDSLPKKTCFNCLGDHSLSECDKKKNFNQISINRKKILGSKRSANVRYHEDTGNKFGGKLKPGEISQVLRDALRLKNNEAPEFVYRMRVLGYPPGWLKEAEVQRSDVSVFDGTGKAMSHPEDEEGETDMQVVKYQPEKLISYPGFNAPFPQDIRDQSRWMNYPLMQKHHRRECFHEFMTMNKASKYKRKKLKLDDAPNSAKDLIKSSGDMEVDNTEMNNTVLEFNPPLPSEDPPSAPLPSEDPPSAPLPSTPSGETSPLLVRKEDGEISEDSNDSKSESELLKSSDKSVDQTAFISSTPEDPSLNVSIATTDATSGVSTMEETSLSPSTPSDVSCYLTPSSEKRKGTEDSELSTYSDSLVSRPKKHHRSRSKGFTLGVCLPSSITPFRELPDPSKWSVDVSDHILFDNLPDALGTWKKMKGLVKKVQNVMETINAD